MRAGLFPVCLYFQCSGFSAEGFSYLPRPLLSFVNLLKTLLSFLPLSSCFLLNVLPQNSLGLSKCLRIKSIQNVRLTSVPFSLENLPLESWLPFGSLNYRFCFPSPVKLLQALGHDTLLLPNARDENTVGSACSSQCISFLLGFGPSSAACLCSP